MNIGEICEIVCNLDDMTGEDLGFALEIILENGALDAYTTAIQMKKNRPGYMLTCLCKPEDEDKFAALILRHTTTLGVRTSLWRRHTMERRFEQKRSDLGDYTLKTATGSCGTKSKIEYDDLASLAREHNLTISEVRKKLSE